MGSQKQSFKENIKDLQRKISHVIDNSIDMVVNPRHLYIINMSDTHVNGNKVKFVYGMTRSEKQFTPDFEIEVVLTFHKSGIVEEYEVDIPNLPNEWEEYSELLSKRFQLDLNWFFENG